MEIHGNAKPVETGFTFIYCVASVLKIFGPNMGSHSWGALAKLEAPRKPEDLSEVSPEPDLWEDEDDVDAFPELNYYEDFYGLGFPELDSMHSTVKFPTKGRIKRFLKQSIAKETVENFLRSHGFSSDAMDTQSWSHGFFLPFERLGPLHRAAKEGKREASHR